MQTGKCVISDYLDELSSSSPIPGGGGVAAVTGALGVSLASMVCSLTIGKKKYAEFEDRAKEIKEHALSLLQVFLKHADDDATAFLPLSQAYSMPKETEEQKNERNTVMQKALLEAASVPLELIRCCTETIYMFEELLEGGSVLAVSDVGVGARMISTAAESALLNVYINTKMMDDKELAERMNTEALENVELTVLRLKTVFEQVVRKVKG